MPNVRLEGWCLIASCQSVVVPKVLPWQCKMPFLTQLSVQRSSSGLWSTGRSQQQKKCNTRTSQHCMTSLNFKYTHTTFCSLCSILFSVSFKDFNFGSPKTITHLISITFVLSRTPDNFNLSHCWDYLITFFLSKTQHDVGVRIPN